MKHRDDKLVKVLLSTGQAVHLYADIETIEEVVCHPKFVRFKDDGNDNIYVSIESISGFEILDDRTDGGPKNAEEIKEVASVPDMQ